MPIAINSPARNLFLLGSSGSQVVTNFFKTIDQSGSSSTNFLPEELRYYETPSEEDRYVLAGTARDNGLKPFGWVETRGEDGTSYQYTSFSAVQTQQQIGYESFVNLKGLELDSSGNLIACGGLLNSFDSDPTPWIAKFSKAGVLSWQSSSFTGNVTYHGLASDSNDNYYACGYTSITGNEERSFVEKFDSDGNPGWGKSAVMLGRKVNLEAIDANERGHVVAVGYLEDDTNDKGYIVKVDTATGEILWDRTLETNGNVKCSDIFIDSNDIIYVTANMESTSVIGTTLFQGCLLKYTAEGNLIWQTEADTPTDDSISFNKVQADSQVESVVVFGIYFDHSENKDYGLISKYAKDGSLVWRRTLESSSANGEFFETPALDSDSSYYYVLFTDENSNIGAGTPDEYTFAKVSSSGNGLGAFQYDDGNTGTVDYVFSSITDKICKLVDGSVRNDTTELMTYPFGANKLLFDDFATHVSNKKRQMDSADSFAYGGSPAVRNVDFKTAEYTPDGYGVPPQKNYIGLSESLQPASTTSNPSPNSTWTRQTTNVTITPNVIANPLGVGSGAEKYNINATAGRRLEYGVVSGVFVAGQKYTYSWWMKAINPNARWAFQALTAGNSNNSIRIADRDGNILENISTTNTTNYTPKDTEWHRVVWTFTANNTTGSAIGGYNDNSETGDLWYLWGAQLVDGPDPLRYYRNHNGVPENAAGTEHAPSIIDGAYEFDQTEMLQIGEVPEIGDEFTVELWFKSDTHSYYQNPIDCNYGTQDVNGNGAVNSGNVGPRLEINGLGSFFWAFGSTLGANDPYFALPAGSGVTGVWYHAVITYNGSGATGGKSYLNGENVATSYKTSVGSAGWIGEFRNVVLGRGFTLATRYFDGRIGEVRFYPKALTAAQVFQNYNATKSKYINEAADTAPKIGPSIVYSSNLKLNYDFGNRATYDRAENILFGSEDWNHPGWLGYCGAAAKGYQGVDINTTDVLTPDGDNTAIGFYRTSSNCAAGNAYGIHWFVSNSGGGALVQSGQTYTVSAYLRGKVGGETVQLGFDDGATTNHQLTTEWARYTHTGTPTTGTTRGFQAVVNDQNAGFYLWHPQVESGSSVGRYVPTYGTSITAPTTVKNLSSSSYTGTINGAVFNTDGYFEFDGQNDYIDAGDLGSFYTQGTINFWINSTAVVNYKNPFHTHYLGTNAGIRFEQYTTGDFNVIIGDDNSNYGGYQYMNGTMTTNTWYNIGLVWNTSANLAVGYLNGSQVFSSSHDKWATTMPNVTIGNGFSGTRYYQGRFGELQMYNSGLSSAQILQNYNASKSKYGL